MRTYTNYNMNAVKIILLLFCLQCATSGYGQQFEGKIVYGVKFDIQVLKDAIIQRMKDDGQYYDTLLYYIKDNRYLKENNARNKTRVLYDGSTNLVTIFSPGNAVNIDANKTSFVETCLNLVDIVQYDADTVINNITCQKVVFVYNSSVYEEYYYNKDILKVDPELFAAHNYEYLNKLLENTGTFPIHFTKVLGKITIEVSLLSYSEEELSDDTFNVD